MINEDNIIVVIGDLGSGVNLVKNLLLVPENTLWLGPHTTNRAESVIQTLYPITLKDNLASWLSHEYIFRSWKSLLGVDIADNYADINTPQVKEYSQTKKIVFLTHWPDIASQLKIKYPGITLVSLYPDNIDELAWQVKTYILKKSIETLQEFSFVTSEEKIEYINHFGLDSYYQTNVLNMCEIMWARHAEYKNVAEYTVKIGELIGNDTAWINRLKLLNPDLNTTQSLQIVNAWKKLHPYNQNVWDFEYFKLARKSPVFFHG